MRNDVIKHSRWLSKDFPLSPCGRGFNFALKCSYVLLHAAEKRHLIFLGICRGGSVREGKLNCVVRKTSYWKYEGWQKNAPIVLMFKRRGLFFLSLPPFFSFSRGWLAGWRTGSRQEEEEGNPSWRRLLFSLWLCFLTPMSRQMRRNRVEGSNFSGK